MTLAFSQVIKGKETYFVEQINNGIINSQLADKYDIAGYERAFSARFGFTLKEVEGMKLHTIRKDLNNKWKAGNLIHFAINNRTPRRFQFAPVLECVSTQKIEIHHTKRDGIRVTIDDNKKAYVKKLEKGFECYNIGDALFLDILAHNDGFSSLGDFFEYFNEDFKGKIIHWTDFKY